MSKKKIQKEEGPDAKIKIHGLAIASLVLAIVGFFVAGIPLGVLALVFALVSKKKIETSPDRIIGKGLAIAGGILGILVAAGAIILYNGFF